MTYTGNTIETSSMILPITTGAIDKEAPKGEIVYAYKKVDGLTRGLFENYTDGLPTETGSYKIKAQIKANGNYTATNSENELNLTIAKATPTITINKLNDKIYDGFAINNPKEMDMSFIHSIYKDVTFEYSSNKEMNNSTKIAPTDAGIYYVQASVVEKDNTLAISSNVQSFTIKKKQINVDYPTASEVIYGNNLSKSLLSFIENDYGSFSWTNDKVLPRVGNNGHEVKFIPTVEIAKNYEIINLVQDIAINVKAKDITVSWENLIHTYDGNEKIAKTTPLNLEENDIVTTICNDTKINEGSYEIVIELIGKDSGNYNLKNPKNTLIIQKAPVKFTVENNSFMYDEETKKAKVSSLTYGGNIFSDFNIDYKNEKGDKVVNPIEVGNYGIYVTIYNTNYRHVTTTDGSSQKIGVLNIYKETPPPTYLVSFEGGDGATGNTPSIDASISGTKHILPMSGFKNGDKIFVGWNYKGKTYQENDILIQPKNNVEMLAQWIDSSYEISGIVIKNGKTVSNAVVTLMSGGSKIEQKTTNMNGEYIFDEVLPESYNLVVTKDGIIKTEFVEIVNENVEKNIELPQGKTNSVVEVKSGTPNITVGNFENQFTEKDIKDSENGSEIELKLIIEQINDPSDSEAIKEISENIGIYLDLDYLKTTIDSDGNKLTTEYLKESQELLQLSIPLIGDLQGKKDYIIYRIHEGELNTLTTTPNSDGEYIVISDDKKSITLYTKKFSTYAVAYIDPMLTIKNGGSGSIGNGNQSEGNEVIIEAGTKIGYTFNYWSSNDNIVFANANSASTKIEMPAKDITITANWTLNYVEPNVFDIEITEGNNGNITPEADYENILYVYKDSNQKFNIIPNKGYIISDVLIDGKSIGAKSSYTFKNIKGNHSIEAKFEKIQYYTLSFDTMGGNGVNNQEFKKYSIINIDEITAKDGYTFVGWYLDKSYEFLAIDFEMTSNMTVYAKWELADTNKDIVDTNDGVGDKDELDEYKSKDNRCFMWIILLILSFIFFIILFKKKQDKDGDSIEEEMNNGDR